MLSKVQAPRVSHGYSSFLISLKTLDLTKILGEELQFRVDSFSLYLKFKGHRKSLESGVGKCRVADVYGSDFTEMQSGFELAGFEAKRASLSLQMFTRVLQTKTTKQD